MAGEGVRPGLPGSAGEGRTSALMLAHSFAIGTGTVFFETAASALFLPRFDPQWIPPLVSVTGVADLLLVSAAGLTGALALVSVLTAGADGAPPRSEPAEVGLRRAIDRAREPYLTLVLGITVFAILSKYFVDFAFLEQLKSRYEGAQELAGFFGLYSGATQALSLLTRVVLSGPLLSRFGIRVGLLVLPLAHLLCTLLLVAAGAGSGSAGAVFWLVMANQGIYKVLKHPIDNPSFRVLYQPLRPRDRLAAQILVETIVSPLGAGVAGAAGAWSWNCRSRASAARAGSRTCWPSSRHA